MTVEQAVPTIDPDYADILVECPIPGQNHEPQTLAEFMKTEVGQRVIRGALETAGVLIEKAGMDKVEALQSALPGAIVTDEKGQVKRSPAESFEPQLAPQESKKK